MDMVLRDYAAADERTWLATIDTVAVHPDHRQRGIGRFSSVAVEQDRAGLESIAALVQAHQLLDDGHLTGRIVLTTD
jgi:GNAT superfamily N-acetyltransferase